MSCHIFRHRIHILSMTRQISLCRVTNEQQHLAYISHSCIFHVNITNMQSNWLCICSTTLQLLQMHILHNFRHHHLYALCTTMFWLHARRSEKIIPHKQIHRYSSISSSVRFWNRMCASVFFTLQKRKRKKYFMIFHFVYFVLMY